jgi:signal recognition particle subunit SRP54
VFNLISEKFEQVFDRLSGRGRIRQEDVEKASREIKLGLLAADVNFKVVKQFVDSVSTRAVGAEVLDSITPHQQFIKIIHDELVNVLGGESPKFDFACAPPMVVMVVGLQGSGKTTASAKFALHCKEIGRRPLLVPADVHRPAAIDQLKKLAEDANVSCYPSSSGDKAVKIAKGALKFAKNEAFDTVIIDTAGRLHIDEEMMKEVRDIHKKVDPHHILYVADAMTGQDALTSATAFDQALPISGIMLTKLDGDARGGAALSISAVTGKKVLFAGVGEKLKDFESFHPDRMARRILGKGDVISLVEKVEQEIDHDEMEDLTETVTSGRFTLEDYRKYMRMMRKMGPADKILGMIPGLTRAARGVDSKEMGEMMKRRDAIICSMTSAERKNPKILNGSRRKRIAQGSGNEVSEVNRMIKEYKQIQEMMGRFKGGKMKNLLKGLTGGVFS